MLDQKPLNDIKHAGAFQKGQYILEKKHCSGWRVANGLKKIGIKETS